MKIADIKLVLVAACLAALAAVTSAEQITFSENIAAIVHDKCSSCHRPGQSAPFSLLTYEQVSERADTIAAVLDDGYMPPWKNVVPDVAFQHDRRLAKSEYELIKKWVAAGAPQGDPSRTPQIPKFSKDWQLGRPDLIVEMNGQYPVPADGPDIHRSFVFPVNLPSDKWVKAIEIKSQARSTLHHALFFVDAARAGREEDGKDGRAGITGMGFLGRSALVGARKRDSGPPSISLGGYVPGTTPMLLPGDNAMLLPKGADVIMQTHFHPSGKPETEHVTMALYFADRPPSRRLASIMIPPLFGRFAGLDIPAGDANHTMTDSFRIPVDVKAIRVASHAHYLGKEMDMTAQLPNGKTVRLLQIADWEFDWQDTYQFAAPVDLPAGTVLHAKVVHDNSKANFSNPNSPPKRVAWGTESFDEMGSVTLQVVATHAKDQDRLHEAVRAKLRDAVTQSFRSRVQQPGEQSLSGPMFKRLDKNGDGALDETELEAAPGPLKVLLQGYKRRRGDRR